MATIKAVSDKTGISAYTLRFYEKEGLINPPRNEMGVRDYDRDSLKRIYAISHYRHAGVSIAQIKQIFNSPGDDAFHLALLRERKESLMKEIEELEDTLHYLDFKINVHEGKNPVNMTLEKWLAAWDENPEEAVKIAA